MNSKIILNRTKKIKHENKECSNEQFISNKNK